MVSPSNAQSEDREAVLDRRILENIIFRRPPLRRYTQDSPILPDVWFEYGRDPSARVDLLLTPRRDATPGALFCAVRDRLERDRPSKEPATRKGGSGRRSSGQSAKADLAYSQSTVAGRFLFPELLRVILPLTAWDPDEETGTGRWTRLFERMATKTRQNLADGLLDLEHGKSFGHRESMLWLIQLAGTIELAGRARADGESSFFPPERITTKEDALALVDAVVGLLAGMPALEPGEEPLIFSVSRNRPASTAVWRSVEAVKADAARRLFNVSCAEIRWAVLDSGIDARHPAFRLRDRDGKAFGRPFPQAGGHPVNRTRVVATYDFTRIRELLNPKSPLPGGDPMPRDLIAQLENGRLIDWGLFAPMLTVPHTDAGYVSPTHEHGTHVAGILGGDWPAGANNGMPDRHLLGVSPDIRLYDIRVLDDQGRGDEFSIIAALQFIRYLNANKDHQVVHGVNLSLSIPHDVANYACGRTPVCDECERLWQSGVIVVAAAGNEGYVQYMTAAGVTEGYRNISITDPGNADAVITVGATHRYRPHTYGVSYFSSRGPTGDGRSKPDLVAPGEKIWSCVPSENVRTFDGTSMAAPHVSGCAALLLARHRELVGQPGRVKQVLVQTATDLGRERYFQGSGMVDVLRAMQSI